jgi:hypothetical protein
MKVIEFFNYKKVAEDLKVPPGIVKQIEGEVKKEFPSDKMLYELHVLRALKSKYWKKISFNEA